jgi:hypothetical protein
VNAPVPINLKTQEGNIMAYYVNRKIGSGFDDAVERVTRALTEEQRKGSAI